jgi:hypothetical protein
MCVGDTPMAIVIILLGLILAGCGTKAAMVLQQPRGRATNARELSSPPPNPGHRHHALDPLVATRAAGSAAWSTRRCS